MNSFLELRLLWSLNPDEAKNKTTDMLVIQNNLELLSECETAYFKKAELSMVSPEWLYRH